MKILFAVLVLSLAISSVTSLTCYFCHGTNGTACAHPPTTSMIAQHPCNNQHCSTLVYHAGNGTTVYVRGCNPSNFCSNPGIPAHQLIDCRTCNRDRCNSSSIIKGSALTSIFILTIALAFSKTFFS
ncbi:uncharacterized protein LOC129790507 [Lutzomyia longipalpis]|uniref:Putative conserved secreted protein n=1 Tax=Lutzomyia longipalpis TaxID=7200 RepID=A0A7G3AD51_LUTLO|nr:uncharacterized protein LOC129790507 [Lutzomyia longipalpis]